MTNIRTVKFDSPNAFLEATKPWDDSFMNFCVGAVSDRIGQDAATIHLLAVYRGDDLLYVLLLRFSGIYLVNGGLAINIGLFFPAEPSTTIGSLQ